MPPPNANFTANVRYTSAQQRQFIDSGKNIQENHGNAEPAQICELLRNEYPPDKLFTFSILSNDLLTRKFVRFLEEHQISLA